MIVAVVRVLAGQIQDPLAIAAPAPIVQRKNAAVSASVVIVCPVRDLSRFRSLLDRKRAVSDAGLAPEKAACLAALKAVR